MRLEILGAYYLTNQSHSGRRTEQTLSPQPLLHFQICEEILNPAFGAVKMKMKFILKKRTARQECRVEKAEVRIPCRYLIRSCIL